MHVVAAAFDSADEIRRAIDAIMAAGVTRDELGLIIPSVERLEPSLPDTAGHVGPGATAAAVGATAGLVSMSTLIPGVGVVVALGLAAATILGLGALGATNAGRALDAPPEVALPQRHRASYEDALRRGRSVLLARVADRAAPHVALAFRSVGATTITDTVPLPE